METHNFELSEEQIMILDTVRRFAEEQAAPQALQNDEEKIFVRKNFESLAELGMLGLPVAEESGGAELGFLSFVVALEELAMACGSTARLLLSQAGLCAKALEGLSQASTQVQEITTGEKLGAYVGPELLIRAQATEDGFRLTGEAPMVTAAMQADLFVVVATTAEGESVIFCLEASTMEREIVQVLGFNATAPGRVVFAEMAVADDRLVARGDEAKAATERASLAARIGGGAMALGMAAACLQIARDHAEERIAFGKPLMVQQAVALKLADCRRTTEAARHLVYHAARLADAGQDAAEAAAMAKLAATEAALMSADEGIQILGGFGYTVEYHVERHYRDAKTLEVLDGGAEELRVMLT